MKKILRRSLFTILALILLAVIFYTEENARGKHAWNKAKQRFEARGASMDWSKYIPPAVPDDQNFFKAPKMTEWFVKGSTFTNDLVRRMTNLKTTGAVGSASNAITSELLAKNYVAWSDQYQPDFDLIREALKRPYARIDCDYSVPFAIQIPNFIAVRVVAQTLAQRAHCHLILKQPQAALEDLTLLHDMRHLLEGAPTHQPMTLVAAMINVAVSGLYAEAVSDGTKWHSWNEQQLAELQKQISDVNLTPYVYDALRTEPVSTCEVLRSITFISFLSEMGNSHIDLSSKIIDRSIPRGWMYQNMANIAMLNEKTMAGYDLEHDTISPRKFDDAARYVDEFLKRKSPYRYFAAIAIPNFSKAEQTTAHNQTLANEAQIACALERYRLANGKYPNNLDMLVPQFMDKLPHDLIGGGQLLYHPVSNEKFSLYSVGWNEKDDDGVDSSQMKGATTPAQGDWVWEY